MSENKGQTDGLTVSGDGSWRKRGFSPLYGITSLIRWFTRKVVDVIVKSKYCKACEYWERKADSAEYEKWKISHEKKCQTNHADSSGKMEVDAVVDAKPYDGSEIIKKECIGHVQKHMGTRLRKLVKKQKGLSGRSKLTGKLIDELSIYYGSAIRRHCDSTENMKKSIWSTLYHKISTDTKPQHHYCPEGADSWCTWQLAKTHQTLDSYKHYKLFVLEFSKLI